MLFENWWSPGTKCAFVDRVRNDRSTSADRSDFTVSSPIPSTHVGIWACGSTWRCHTGKHGSSAHINVSLNRPPDRMWHRPPGRPRNKWLDQLRNDSTRLIGELWRRAVDRGHGGATTRRPSLVMRPQWWWWFVEWTRRVCGGQNYRQ